MFERAGLAWNFAVQWLRDGRRGQGVRDRLRVVSVAGGGVGLQCRRVVRTAIAGEQ